MIIIKNRKLLIPEDERYIGTTADSNSEVLTFRIDRFTQTEMDLSTFTVKADIYRYETEEMDRADLEMEVQEKYILLHLYITSGMVAYPGTILIDIKAFNDDGVVKWSSYKGAFFVADPFETPQATQENLTELEQLEARINRAIATAYGKAAEVVGDWLEENIGEIEGYVIDKSLTVENAAADAKSVGDTVAQMRTERPYVTPEMFGAYGDGVHDDSTAIQSAINASLTNGIRLLAKGKTYLVGTGLRIVGSRNQSTLEVETGADIDIDFSTSTIRYTGTDYAFTMSMIDKGRFHFGTIEASSGGGILMQSDSRWNYISYLNISGGCIAVNAAKDCITVSVSATGWANQNKISDIHFKSGLYPTHFVCASANKINEWIIENVSLEGVEEGHYLEAHSETDINYYIRSIKYWYNRGIEHINNGKKFLKTYGRVIGVTIYSSYGAWQLPSSYEFNYDSSGTTSYSHIANNFDIYAEGAKCKVINGKFIENPYMFASACNITPIAQAENDAGSMYRNYYGTVTDFATILPSWYPGLISPTDYVNLDNRWLAGTPTDTQSSRQLVQKITTQIGTAFYRRYKDGSFSDWSMSPLVKTERKTLNENTFSMSYNAWGILCIAHPSMDRFSAYLVRFGGDTAPTQILSVGWTRDWTVTKQSGLTLYFENSQYPTAEMFVAFLQLG